MEKLNLGDKVKLIAFDQVARDYPRLLTDTDELYGIGRSVYENIRTAEDLTVSSIHDHSEGSPDHIPEYTYSVESKENWTASLFIIPEQCFDKVEVNDGADSTVTDSGAL